MPQKIDVHGLFIDPETITDLLLQKRISVFYPVFYEVVPTTSFFRRATSKQQHTLQFDHLEPYGIILADAEQPDTASFIVQYKQAVMEKLLKGVFRAGKNAAGHIAEHFKIDISGDRQYRILQSGRIIKQISIRDIPAKVRLLNGQWVDVFKSSPEYDFQGGNPYAVTDVDASALMITTKDKCFVLFGAGIDASNEDVNSAYHSLTAIYNSIQNSRDSLISERSRKIQIRKPQVNIQLPSSLGKGQDKALLGAVQDTDSTNRPH